MRATIMNNGRRNGSRNNMTGSPEIHQTLYIGLDKQKFQRKIVNIFLPINLNMRFGCSKEPSH